MILSPTLRFNGADNVDFGDVAAFSLGATGKLTVEMLLDLESINSEQQSLTNLLTKGNTGAYEWGFALGSTNTSIGEPSHADHDLIQFFVWTTGGASISRAIAPLTDALLADNGWVPIAAVVDSTAQTIKLYIDGVHVATSPSWSGSFADTTSSMRLGRRQDEPGWAHDLDARVADVRIWSVARTDAQIAAKRKYGVSLSGETGLEGRWLLNEGSGTTATDSSGASRNGTITGAAWEAATSPSPRFKDDFESITVGQNPRRWRVTEPGSSTANVDNHPVAGKAILLSDAAAADVPVATRQFPGSEPIGKIKVELRPTVTNAYLAVRLGDPNGKSFSLYFYNDGTIRYAALNNDGTFNTDSALPTATNYSANTTYVLELVWDFSGGVNRGVDVYVDGVLKGTDLNSNVTASWFGINGVDRFQVAGHSATTGNLWVDNLALATPEFALNFDDVNDKVAATLPAAINTGDWTIGAWIKPLGTASEGYIIPIDDGSQVVQMLYYHPPTRQLEGRQRFSTAIANSASVSSGTDRPGNDEWVCVFAEFSSSDNKVYLYWGDLDTAVHETPSYAQQQVGTGTRVTGATHLGLGNGKNLSGPYGGGIARPFMFNRRLTLAEKEAYRLGAEPPTSDSSLKFYFPLEEGSGGTTTDDVASISGTITEATWITGPVLLTESWPQTSGLRVTQTYIETAVVDPWPAIRITQDYVEVAVIDAWPAVRITQDYIEVAVYLPTELRLAQQFLEVGIGTGYPSRMIVSKQFIEVAVKRPTTRDMTPRFSKGEGGARTIE